MRCFNHHNAQQSLFESRMPFYEAPNCSNRKQKMEKRTEHVYGKLIQF